MKLSGRIQYLASAFISLLCLSLASCGTDDDDPGTTNGGNNGSTIAPVGPTMYEKFGASIDFEDLPNYANQPIPEYITLDNEKGGVPITDKGATLGRILFYDVTLSIDNTISCGSCHQQKFAFTDAEIVSNGVLGGKTARSSMRLANIRFSDATRFFWDKRAPSLEVQTTMPLKDHNEFGFSGKDDRPDFDDLLDKMRAKQYYYDLFEWVYGDPEITEWKIQQALSQFVRSIQSFDSKYDEGYASNFQNFTEQEKKGLSLFTAGVVGVPDEEGVVIRNFGGLGCGNCHFAPEFALPDTLSGNNGIIGVAGDPDAVDIGVTRAPSLRDLFNPQGEMNGRLMHTGEVGNMDDLIRAVGRVVPNPRNSNLFGGFPPGGFDLAVTPEEVLALEAFLKTLTGSNVYTDPKYSDPFQ